MKEKGKEERAVLALNFWRKEVEEAKREIKRAKEKLRIAEGKEREIIKYLEVCRGRSGGGKRK